jgi:hypothetical protein
MMSHARNGCCAFARGDDWQPLETRPMARAMEEVTAPKNTDAERRMRSFRCR